MWVVIGIAVAILGLGAFNSSHGRGELMNQNTELQNQVEYLKQHQESDVNELDGVQITNLLNVSKDNHG